MTTIKRKGRDPGTGQRASSVLHWCWVLQRLADDNLDHIVFWDLELLQLHFVSQRPARKEPALAARLHSFCSMQPPLHVVDRVCAAHHEFEVFACGQAQTELTFISGIRGWLRDVQSLQVALFFYHVDWWGQAIYWKLVPISQLIVALCQRTCTKRRGEGVSSLNWVHVW